MPRPARNRTATMTGFPFLSPLFLTLRVFGDRETVQKRKGGPAIRRGRKSVVGGWRGRMGKRGKGKGGRQEEQLGRPNYRKLRAATTEGVDARKENRTNITGRNGGTESARGEGGDPSVSATDDHDYTDRS